MSKILRSSSLGLFLATALIGVAVRGQQSQETQAGPIPPQITSAKRIFISNAGTSNTYDIAKSNACSGGPNRACNQFYAALKALGQYDLVSAPSDADLVFESVRSTGPMAS